MIRLLHPLLWLARPLAERISSKPTLSAVQDRLVSAGLREEISASEFLAYKLVLPGLLVGAWLLFTGITHPGGIPCLAVFGYLFPDLWLRGRRQLREQALLRRLPFAIDLLTLCVEAGLDFSQALAEVAQKLGESPLSQEIHATLRQIRLGSTRAEALRDLSRRVRLPEVGSLCSVLIQADRLGVGIGKALRGQSDRLRTRRYHRAEELGAAAGQKILVPLILLILPSMVLLIFAAVGLSFIGGV